MAIKQYELSALKPFLPEGTYESVIEYLHRYSVYLKITKERKSILGTYKPAHVKQPHTITVNGNLNPYHFLVTFIHELAHLTNFIENGNKVLPHGREWKNHYASLLHQFLNKNIFPADVEKALQNSSTSVAATTCGDIELYKVLSKYNKENNKIIIENLSIHDIFKIDNGTQYRIIEKRRTRYLCENIHSKKRFLFPGIYEVFKE